MLFQTYGKTEDYKIKHKCLFERKNNGNDNLPPGSV